MEDKTTAMYIIVNSDLGMGKGKIAGQCCHTACGVTRILERTNPEDAIYRSWCKDGETKVVLRATLKEMQTILEEFEVDRRVKRESSEIWCLCVRDAGRTQIAADSLTSIAFRPMLRSKAPIFLHKMKLL
jgi:PTH2 family peptidyl-tRNA hydrolase